jgi:hypothetical protein
MAQIIPFPRPLTVRAERSVDPMVAVVWAAGLAWCLVFWAAVIVASARIFTGA